MPIRSRTRARSKHAWLLAAMTAGGATTAAAAPPLPDDFLEYLGSWDADDADWLVAKAVAVATVPDTSNATPKQTTTEKRGAAQSPATAELKQ